MSSLTPPKRKFTRPPNLTLTHTASIRTPTPPPQCIEESTSQGLFYTAISRRGRRKSRCEDRFCILPFATETEEGEPVSLICLFDGHGGDRAARVASRRVPQLVLQELDRGVKEALCHAFEETDREVNDRKEEEGEYKGGGGMCGQVVLQRVGRRCGSVLYARRSFRWNAEDEGVPLAPRMLGRMGSRKVEEWIGKSGVKADCGTTATVVVMVGERLIVGHVGDSRAVLVKGDGSVERIFEDHRPCRRDEVERIEAAGGLVVKGGGGWRVNGVLGVTRAIGDLALSEVVIARPEIWEGDGGVGVVVASDGLWDFVEDEEVVGRGGRELVEMAWERGSGDDICVVVVDLRLYREVWRDWDDDGIEEVVMTERKEVEVEAVTPRSLPSKTPRQRRRANPW